MEVEVQVQVEVGKNRLYPPASSSCSTSWSHSNTLSTLLPLLTFIHSFHFSLHSPGPFLVTQNVFRQRAFDAPWCRNGFDPLQ